MPPVPSPSRPPAGPAGSGRPGGGRHRPDQRAPHARRSQTGSAPLPRSLSQELDRRARDLGFVAFGIAPADSTPLAQARLDEFLREGRHGDMLWLQERKDQRGSPKGLWPEVRSVVALGFPYTPPLGPNRTARDLRKGNIAAFAQARDYHFIIKPKLKLLATWLAEHTQAEVKVFVDTAPVMEKPLAEAAGIGWQGKHSVILSRKAGCWMLLGVIYTTADLAPLREDGTVGACGSCTACIDACPTGAIVAPYQVDARRCIAYLTVEYKGAVDPELRPLLGNHVFGCDDCLAACPWNKFAQYPTDPTLLPRAELTAPELRDFLELDDADFRAIFSKSPIKRTGRNAFVRNCLYAAGNSGLKFFIPQVTRLLEDPDPVVADAARWALPRLTAD